VPPKIKKIVGSLKKSIPEGLWHKCAACQTVLYNDDLEKILMYVQIAATIIVLMPVIALI
jgi:acetyl-CoA carboxylase beta subunit